MISKSSIIDNLKTLFYALIIAIVIRSFLLQPFYIPSSSMEPNLLVGDRLFVTKYSYGYSKHSFPFSLPLFKNRILYTQPKRGDVIVFKTPYRGDDIFPIRLLCKFLTTCRTDYIKRLIGLPGDQIEFIDGNLYINNQQIHRTKVNIDSEEKINCGSEKCIYFKEKLPNGTTFTTTYVDYGNAIIFIPWAINGIGKKTYQVPEDHYFFLGDNRDNSTDSRFLKNKGPGYIYKDKLVGKAQLLFFSSDYRVGSILKFWDWKNIIRLNRFFKKIN